MYRFPPQGDGGEATGLKVGSGKKTLRVDLSGMYRVFSMLSVAIEWVKWMQFVQTRKLQIRVEHDLVVFYKISTHLVISSC